MLLSLILALVGGAVTLYLLAGTGDGQTGATERVIVAARPIAAGTTLDGDDLAVQEIAKGAAPQDAAREISEVKGSYAALPMVKGELVLRSKVSTTPSGSKLAAIIPEGRVAVSVAVSDVISTGGFVAPGDRVDVLGVVTKSANDDAAVVLRDVPVLAVSSAIIGSAKAEEKKKGTSSSRDNPRSIDNTVTLAVTLEEARRLVQVDELGKLRLALRQRGDSAAALKR